MLYRSFTGYLSQNRNNNKKKNELKPTLLLMNLYFIDFMTKFTFIFLSLPPLTHSFSLTPFPSGEEGKTTYFKKEKKNVTRNKMAPRVDTRGGFRPPLWLLSSAFSYLYDTGQEKSFSISPQVGCRTKCFCPQTHFFNSRVQQLCAHLLLYLSRNNSIP